MLDVSDWQFLSLSVAQIEEAGSGHRKPTCRRRAVDGDTTRLKYARSVLWSGRDWAAAHDRASPAGSGLVVDTGGVARRLAGDLWPRPGRVFAVSQAHTFHAFAGRRRSETAGPQFVAVGVRSAN